MEKIILEWQGGTDFSLADGVPFESLSPKELMLLSLGLCAGKTVASLITKMRLHVTSLHVETDGVLEDGEHPAQSAFSQFSLNFVVEDPDQAEHHKIAGAVMMAHTKYCGVTLMMKKIAPVKVKLFVNGREITAM